MVRVRRNVLRQRKNQGKAQKPKSRELEIEELDDDGTGNEIKPCKRWVGLPKCPKCDRRLRVPAGFARGEDGRVINQMFLCHSCGWQVSFDPQTRRCEAISPEVIERARNWHGDPHLDMPDEPDEPDEPDDTEVVDTRGRILLD